MAVAIIVDDGEDVDVDVAEGDEDVRSEDFFSETDDGDVAPDIVCYI